jgi:CheY-like chemotaxis protein
MSRLAAGQSARVTCPACRQQFVVQAQAAEPPMASEAAAPREAPNLSADDRAWMRREMEALRVEIERRVTAQVLEAMGVRAPAADAGAADEPEDAKVALVCEPDPVFAQVLCEALRDLGYQPMAFADLATAWRALDRELHVVVVTEAMSDDPAAGTKILDRLSRMPGAKRRTMFVVHVSNEIRSHDGGLSFVLGANMTLNRADAARAKDLIRKGIAERDKLYRPFLRALEAVQHA